jgi:peptidoglycan/LPS O-acetylase OafA/YrhL
MGPPTGYPFVKEVSVQGWVGVDLFFAVSSFLFFTLFGIELERTGRLHVDNFFIRRMLRIYPLMIAVPARTAGPM